MRRRRTRRSSTSSLRSRRTRRPWPTRSIGSRPDRREGNVTRKIIRGGTVVNASGSFAADVLVGGDDEVLAVLERARELDALVMVHCENGFAIQHLVTAALANGQTDPIHHALTRPETMEAEATGRAVRLAEFAGAPVFVVHVSCRDAAEEIIRARSRGVAAYGETCIQYLFNSIDDLRRPDFVGARYVCSPPLRDAANQPFLWDALRFDHLQSISTDHCPFTDEQKRLGFHDFSKIPNGLAAIQHRLPMMREHG